MHDLMLKRNETIKMMDQALESARKRGEESAQAEKEYRIAQSKKMLVLRDSNIPVTILNDIVKGDEAIADLRFKRDLAQVLYKSAQEAINVYKLELKAIEAQIDREYGR